MMVGQHDFWHKRSSLTKLIPLLHAYDLPERFHLHVEAATLAREIQLCIETIPLSFLLFPTYLRVEIRAKLDELLLDCTIRLRGVLKPGDGAKPPLQHTIALCRSR